MIGGELKSSQGFPLIGDTVVGVAAMTVVAERYAERSVLWTVGLSALMKTVACTCAEQLELTGTL